MNIEIVRAIFLLAGFELINIDTATNPYWGQHAPEYAGPQYVGFTTEGTIKIHWRKRVLEIDWGIDTIVVYPIKDQWDRTYAITESITQDEVTKGPVMVHANSYAKAVEYLTQLNRDIGRHQYVTDYARRALIDKLTDQEKSDSVYYRERGNQSL